ncbi:MAG: DNA methyltransferase, partial [Nitrospina sp.]|nr:DNA methyltransferase [Nitrospina sp.]
YGLLSARITNPKGDNPGELSNQMPITNPFLKELMESFLSVGGRKDKSGSGIDFDELGINEVVDLLDNSNMEAVIRDFGDKNPLEDPVIHFYELFLHEYDSKVRMQRGVFYTPRPVVSFIVRSVDELLRKDFGLEDGLADTTTWEEMAKKSKELKIPEGTNLNDPFVQILDPATGTGTFLVEVINLIHKTMVEKWEDHGNSEKKIDQLWNDYVPKHLLPRLHGYELLMAPYAIAHMKIGLKLYETGYEFGSEERARIYLTNALEPEKDFSSRFAFAIPALAHEAKAVNEIKANQFFTIVIGNPPYAYESANNGEWICELIKNFYFVDGSPLGERNPRGLQDDYVKFLRFAQATLSETGMGILGFITNHGYLSNPTFRGMRQSLKDEFTKIHTIDLHGNSKRTEYAPDGTKDENVFDIMQGVAIIFANLNVNQSGVRQILKSDLFGLRPTKNKTLNNLKLSDVVWDSLKPSSPFYLFRKVEDKLKAEYLEGQSITEIFSINSVGISTSRDDLCISFTAEEAYKTTGEFVSLSPEMAREKYHLGEDVQDWKVNLAQEDVRTNGLTMKYITPVFYRPFDVRWTYYSGNTRGFHSRPRGQVMNCMLGGNNLAICSSRQVNEEFRHAFVSQTISDGNSVSLASRERTYIFPLFLEGVDQSELEFSFETNTKRPNLTPQFLNRIAEKMGLPQVEENLLPKGLTAEEIFFYIYAILHSPNFRSRYLEFLKIDFPRLPLTPNFELFLALAKHGGNLVDLHIMKSPKNKEPIATIIGSEKIQVEKVSFSDETVWINNEKTCGFKGVPEEVWKFHIGGYQVCKKWLKDRQGRGGQNPRSGRILFKEDIDHYQKIIVAISETIRIMAEIDEVIEEHGGWPGAFVTE